VLQPVTSPLTYPSPIPPVIPTPYVIANPATCHRVTLTKERWTNYDSSRPIYANPAVAPIQPSSMGTETTRVQAPSHANSLATEPLKYLGSTIQQGFSLP